MKYQIKKLEINNFSVFEENKIAGRSYFIPYSSKTELLSQSALNQRYNSDQTTVLSGKWKFKYFSKVSRLPNNIDTDNMTFDEITVPSCWQRTGYESPVYINTRYEFPMTLPNVPDEMSAGVYVKKFDVKDATKDIIITFLGVCSSLTLYVNGKYVGYSEGSHNSAEFSLGSFVKDGENELLAIVSKWCNGTYLECQDMFRENGIFRDVYITENPDNRFFDYHAKTEREEDGYSLKVSVSAFGPDLKNISLIAELLDGEKAVAVKEVKGDTAEIDFGTLNVKEWTAETPNLYTLVLSLADGEKNIQSVCSKIGFRKIEIQGEKFLFNSKLIKFKGVNHHDTHEKTGYVMSAEDLLRDVKLMKEFNVNAVRTSHYPPDPIFMDLCDEYGLYVIDEADIETHGTQFSQGFKVTMKPNIISNDKKWLSRYTDRVMRMYQRDKNHVSVTMWSLGNESGGWKNHDVCYKMLKEVTDIPVHYEAVIRTIRGSYDVISEMYQHPHVVKRIGEHKMTGRYRNKPYFLCEYCHAMGVSPGALEEYWNTIYKYENLTGGCIWEWADHSVYDKNAKYKYTYGGDHGEKYHDGNFCVDGLFYPDRTPHTGAYTMKNVYRPVRCEKGEKGEYIFRNTNSFAGTDDVKLFYELLEEGKVIEKGEAVLDIAPLESAKIKINHKTPSADKDTHITFIYKDEEGNVIAKEQLTLAEKVKNVTAKEKGNIHVKKKGEKTTITFEKGMAVFSNTDGRLVSYKLGDKEIIHNGNGFMPIFYRPFLDNDRNIVNRWKKAGITSLETSFRSLEVHEKEKKVKVKSKYALTFKGKDVFDVEMNYKVYSDGTVSVKVEAERCGLTFKDCDIPRFGVNVKLCGDMQNAEYFGLGEKENLPDLKAQSIVGIYSATVPELDVPYIRPQDNGNHGECRYLKLTDEKGEGIAVYNKDKHFSFSAHNYSNETLEKAKHLEDIKTEDFVSLNIDGFMRGTGTNSCGPDTLKEYRIDFKKELSFGFYIVPLGQEGDE